MKNSELKIAAPTSVGAQSADTETTKKPIKITIFPTPPEPVRRALLHVRSFYPDVVMVAFQSDGRWQYMDANFKGPKFGPEVDVGILEAASNSVNPCMPALFELEEGE